MSSISITNSKNVEGVGPYTRDTYENFVSPIFLKHFFVFLMSFDFMIVLYRFTSDCAPLHLCVEKSVTLSLYLKIKWFLVICFFFKICSEVEIFFFSHAFIDFFKLFLGYLLYYYTRESCFKLRDNFFQCKAKFFLHTFCCSSFA